jgi:hypothetical protein
MNHNSLIRHEQTLDPVTIHDILTGRGVHSLLLGVNIKNVHKTGRPIGVSIFVCNVITTINSRMLASENA